jgi:hypothetical protein
MKEQLLKWKSIFIIEEFKINEANMTDQMLDNMIMHYSHNIESLTFSSNSTLTLFDDKGALCHQLSYLSNNFKHLSFNGKIMSDVFLAPLLSCLENLVYLELDECNIQYDADQYMLMSLKLIRLKIDHSCVLLNGLSHLSSLLNLFQLELTNCEVPEEEFFHLSLCVNLTYLDLSGSTISDSGLSHLSSLIRLTKLKIIGDSRLFEESGLVFLTSLSSLTFLKLISCTIYNEGLCCLASCINLTYLDLSGSYLENGLFFLSSLSKIKHLDLSLDNVITKKDLRYLAGSTLCCNLTYLNLGTRCTISDEEISHIVSFCANLTFFKVARKIIINKK